MLWCGLVLTDVNTFLQGSFTGDGAIAQLPQRQWSNQETYG